jgi:hypothetical protein
MSYSFGQKVRIRKKKIGGLVEKIGGVGQLSDEQILKNKVIELQIVIFNL